MADADGNARQPSIFNCPIKFNMPDNHLAMYVVHRYRNLRSWSGVPLNTTGRELGRTASGDLTPRIWVRHNDIHLSSEDLNHCLKSIQDGICRLLTEAPVVVI